MDILYYRINRKSNLILFPDLAMEKTKSALASELNNSSDKYLGQKMDNIFNIILNKYNSKGEKIKDKLEIIHLLLEQYRKLKKIKISDNTLATKICQIIALKNYTTSFSFTSTNISEVATLLLFGFKKLKKRFIEYDKFFEEINKERNKQYNLIQSYQLMAQGNENIKIKEGDTPIEFLLLLEAFKNVKSLEISIEEATRESIITYLIILLNYEWLFPCVFDLYLDLSCYKLNQEVMSVYKKKFNQFYGDFLNNGKYTDFQIVDKILEEIKKNENKEQNTKKEKNKINSKEEKEALKLKEKKTKEFNDMLSKLYTSIIKNNTNIFEVLLLLVNFIKKLSVVNKLVINIPDGYNIEINDYLICNRYPNIENIQLVDFLSTVNNLRELDVKFNSMEATTFEKILYMIKNNSNLKKLKLNFFPEEKEYFSTYQLLKIEENNFLREMLKKNYINKNAGLNGLLIYDRAIKDEYNLRSKALDNLQKSIENFFVLLQMMGEKNKDKLESLSLVINKPFNLIDKNLFWIMLKLFFNLLLEFNRELLILKEFIFICPYFNLDNNYYSFIETFLSGINLNFKNKIMTNFHLQSQIINIPNISNLISYNLTKLTIGDLDLNSFKSFVTFLHSEEFVENSKLKQLIINLSKTIVVFRECQDEITNLIVGDNPESLVELSLSCHFNIGHDNLIEILTKADGNTVESYTFIMQMASDSDYMNVFKETKFYYVNKTYKNSVNKYLPLLNKFKFFDKDKINIAKRLIKFLVPSNRKKIVFKKNNKSI